MASRRKSTVPCMVPHREPQSLDQEPEEEEVVADVADFDDTSSSDWEAVDADPSHYRDTNAEKGGYECKYCSFQTSDFNLFTNHVDTAHPNVVLNTSYVCMECDYHTRSYDTLLAHNARLHPGEDNFTRTMVRRNNETVFQQTVNDLTFDGSFVKEEVDEVTAVEEEEEETSHHGIAFSKTPIMRRSRPDPKKFVPAHKMASDDIIKVESDEDEDQEPPTLSPAPMTPAVVTAPRLVPISAPLQVQAVSPNIVVNSPNLLQIKGGPGVGGGILPPGTLAQVLSVLQNQQNNAQAQTQLLIPISSIPTYNAAMDNNVLLVSAYNRFPYPSVSEITSLSSQTKFSEEQIKVWFSAQRLKHGVSWTPEEVEEARRKKFNGTVQTIPQTITVIPTNGLQNIFQTCQIVGQPGLVLTQVAGSGGGSTIPVASPITLTVASIPGNQPKAAEASTSDSNAEMSSSSAATSLGFDVGCGKPKKTKEQLAELKASYSRRQFATEAEISRLMQVTKLSKRAIKKWFSDTRYNQRNSKDHHSLLLGDPASSSRTVVGGGRGGGRSFSGLNDGGDGAAAPIIIDSSDDASDSSPTSAIVPGSSDSSSSTTTTPTTPTTPRVKFRHDFSLQKFKEKTPEQLLVLEASFQKSDMPSDEELSRLRAETKLTRREVDAWFTERRKVSSESKTSDAEGDGDRANPSSSAQEWQIPLPVGRKLLKKTPEQLHILKKAFVRSQWPTSEEYDQMVKETGLPRPYIVSWFGDARYNCKNSTLKWYYLYQSGKVDEALNGGAKSPKKPRKRSRGWTKKARRPHPSKRSPQGGNGTIKVKSGKWFLKDYYLRHGALSEKDLDELVAKSSMSYEQVRDWFSQTARRVEEGKEAFSDQEQREQQQEETPAVKHEDSDGEMEVKEQGEEAWDEDCGEEEKGVMEEEEVVEESEGRSQLQEEEQT
ncbi:zinc fingers and homeoboxes protein 1-like isoform 1-T2 [Pholidichthys leucotaenia]